MILSIHFCNNFILESMNSSSYRPEIVKVKIIKIFLIKFKSYLEVEYSAMTAI